MSKNKKIIFVIFLFIFCVAIYLFVKSLANKSVLTINNEGENALNSPSSPQDIEVESQGDTKVFRNRKENLAITTSKDWFVLPHFSEGETIGVQKIRPGQQTDSDVVDGLKLQLYVADNPNKLNIDEWLKTYWGFSTTSLAALPHLTINNITTVKSVQEIPPEEPDYIYGSFLYMTFIWQSRFYEFNCLVFGDQSEVKTHLDECEQIIRLNIETEFK